MSKRFTRTIENFTCEHCGAQVEGNGFTNHCPVCLWSKHVDIYPGDRAETCQGLMQPIGLEKRGGVLSILHQCERCGFERKNRFCEGDNFDTLVALSKVDKI